ncbi:MAG TPA: arylsulfotransferase family protein [Myxococcota bacterium]|nr:arylsulfotransferase family protein [Myxococcota bacterium]
MKNGTQLATLLVWAALTGGGCDSEPTSPEPVEASEAPVAASAKLDAARVEQLRALGYVDTSSSVADPSKSGAVILDPDSVSPGYSLYVAPFDCAAYLIALDGTVVKTWRDELRFDGRTRACKRWQQADLLPDGDLLIPLEGRPRPGQKVGSALLRLGWDGEIVWRRPLSAHHDAEQAPDGRIVALARAVRRDPDFDPAHRVLDNLLLFVSSDGRRIERRISLYDALRDNDLGLELQPRAPRPGTDIIDLFHANSVETLRDPALADRHPLYTPGNLLVSVRHQDAILIVDPETERLVWLWGPGELSGQHDAQMLPNGNVLVFDNGLDRGWSRVIELDPVKKTIEWQYGSGGPDAFFTGGRGSAQKLPNGDVLVANSNEGEAFEVTPDGRVVWRFYRPEIGDDGHREVIVRMVRYPSGPIEARLASEGRP